MRETLTRVLMVRHPDIDVWHEQPLGDDCEIPSDGRLSRRNLRWAWEHRAHLNVRVWPFLRIKYWLTERCVLCGQRFLWNDRARVSTVHRERVVSHSHCLTLRDIRIELEEITDYVLCVADGPMRQRVERRLRRLENGGS